MKTPQPHYADWYNQSPLAVVVVNDKGLLTWLNPVATNSLESSKSVGSKILSTAQIEQVKKNQADSEGFFMVIDEQGYVISSQPSPLHPDETVLWMLPTETPEFDLKTMVSDLAQQRRLANLGRMMLEMAHELNNPLAGISMSTQLMNMTLTRLKKTLSEEPDSTLLRGLTQLEDELDNISQSANRASKLRQELLDHNKPNTLNLKAISIQKLVESAFSNFESQPIFKNITIHKQFLSPSQPIWCDSSKMEQIFYNLVKNARDAMRGSGTLWIREIQTDPGHITLEIEDSGPGVREDLLDKVFSPFLTTKPRTGNGLGLSISQQIIQQHGGEIAVENRPSACFILTFPIAQTHKGAPKSEATANG